MNTLSNTAEKTVEQSLMGLGRSLTHCLSAVIGGMHDSPLTMRPIRLDSATGVGKDVAYRVLKAIRADDPITTVHLMPGPAPLRRLLRAAAKRAVSSQIIAEATQAVDQFEQLIETLAGDREKLDLIIGGWLPEARQKGELLAKQAVFRGMSHMRGLSTEVLYKTTILRPSENGEHVDGVTIQGMRGLRRWRRDAELRFAAGRIHPPLEGSRSLRLDGGPIEKVDDVILSEFTSMTCRSLEVAHTDGWELYSMPEAELGLRSSADLVAAYLTRACLTRYRSPNSTRKSGPTGQVAIPARLLVFDVLVDADIYPESEPRLRIYDTALQGPADMNAPDRDADILPTNDTLSALGTGLKGVRVSEIPRYVELLECVIGRLGCEPRSFRVYRCRSEYPLYGSQVSMAFERGPRP